jgi:integrase
VRANPARMYFVTADEAKKVLDACPDAQWRLIFALCRYGGLRCPSEVLLLKWADIDWERHRMIVHSPKTEHHQGKDMRQVPLFPELVLYLQEAFDHAPAGTEYVITRYRKHNSNLRSHFKRIICKAQLKPWPKLFQNLRSSRETELTEKFPLHVVCAWMGNSQAVAAKHYLQVTDEHFKIAAGKSTLDKIKPVPVDEQK